MIFPPLSIIPTGDYYTTNCSMKISFPLPIHISPENLFIQIDIISNSLPSFSGWFLCTIYSPPIFLHCLWFILTPFVYSVYMSYGLVTDDTVHLSNNFYQYFSGTFWFKDISFFLGISYACLILYTNCSNLFFRSY